MIERREERGRQEEREADEKQWGEMGYPCSGRVSHIATLEG